MRKSAEIELINHRNRADFGVHGKQSEQIDNDGWLAGRISATAARCTQSAIKGAATRLNVYNSFNFSARVQCNAIQCADNGPNEYLLVVARNNGVFISIMHVMSSCSCLHVCRSLVA